MVSNITIHCTCGTDIRIEKPTDPAACPDCETTFELTLVEHSVDHHASSTRYGTQVYRGP
ncbi:hypothetical protein ELS17_13590 [Natrinema altunense]|uniref:C2H2-type domain-containing protein n=1 Tax=Natrinema altunense TaxID=222984 RepID=A0A482XWJ9_9EURY|nr:hypothetical protein ELS17_13590 [Natrinema altunense]